MLELCSDGTIDTVISGILETVYRDNINVFREVITDVSSTKQFTPVHAKLGTVDENSVWRHRKFFFFFFFKWHYTRGKQYVFFFRANFVAA